MDSTGSQTGGASGSDASGTDDRMRRRVPGSSLKLWLLLDANRWAVAGLALCVVFVGLAALVRIDPTPLPASVDAADPIETLFQALLTAIVTGVTLVVSINSLVLSQELGAVGDQRNRMDGALSFREDVAEELDRDVSPADPAAFLGSLVELSCERAARLNNSVSTGQESDLGDEVGGYVEELRENARDVSDRLAGAEFGSFEVLSAALDFDYSRKLHEARRLREEHADALEESTLDALDALADALRLFGPAREHVKTLYFQWALIDLSRAMLYAAIPALIVSVAGILTLDTVGTVPGSTAGVSNLAWVVLGATTVALAPFALLLSYVLRIATVAKRTLAIGPFVLRGTGRSD